MEVLGDERVFDDAADAMVEECRAQALEEAWEGHVSKILSKPEKRAAIIAFIESRTGRPLPLQA
jgi:hypothetical protein